MAASLARLGLFDAAGTRLVPGFFAESLPRALASGELRSLAILRLDGDLYESTIQVAGRLALAFPPGFDMKRAAPCHMPLPL